MVEMGSEAEPYLTKISLLVMSSLPVPLTRRVETFRTLGVLVAEGVNSAVAPLAMFRAPRVIEAAEAKVSEPALTFIVEVEAPVKVKGMELGPVKLKTSPE